MLFSPDDDALATTGAEACVWDTAAAKLRFEPLTHPGGLTWTAFSPDGRTLVTAANDAMIRVWDAITGEPVGEPLPQPFAVRMAEFSPDGRTLITAGDYSTHPAVGEQTYRGGEVRLWDAATREPRGAPMPLPSPLWQVSVSPDGSALLTVCEDGSIHLWDPVTGERLAAPIPGEGVGKSTPHAMPDVHFLTDGPGPPTFRSRGRLIPRAAPHTWEAPAGRRVGAPISAN
jgi:dipeptidyl aminopeptidase/acylaminoacyl peptidase